MIGTWNYIGVLMHWNLDVWVIRINIVIITYIHVSVKSQEYWNLKLTWICWVSNLHQYCNHRPKHLCSWTWNLKRIGTWNLSTWIWWLTDSFVNSWISGSLTWQRLLNFKRQRKKQTRLWPLLLHWVSTWETAHATLAWFPNRPTRPQAPEEQPTTTSLRHWRPLSTWTRRWPPPWKLRCCATPATWRTLSCGMRCGWSKSNKTWRPLEVCSRIGWIMHLKLQVPKNRAMVGISVHDPIASEGLYLSL